MTANNTQSPKDNLVDMLDTLMGDEPHTPVVVRRENKDDLIVVSEATYDRIMAQAMLYRDIVEQSDEEEVSQEDLLKSLASVKAPEDD